MGRRAVLLLLTVGLLLGGAPDPLGAADVPNRTFDAPLDRVWTVTESVLKSLGWEIDTYDRAVGWILTDSRGLDFKDYAVYGKGLRHKLRISLEGRRGEPDDRHGRAGALHGGAHPLDGRAEARAGDRADRRDRDPGRDRAEPVGGVRAAGRGPTP